jgi:hypothetical protein
MQSLFHQKESLLNNPSRLERFCRHTPLLGFISALLQHLHVLGIEP